MSLSYEYHPPNYQWDPRIPEQRSARMKSSDYLLPDEKAEREKEKVEMSRDYPHFTKAQIEDAIRLFEESDKDKNGSIDRTEFSAMMNKLAPESLAENPNFQQTCSLYFTNLDRDKSNSISKKEFLELYNDLFINERTQVALLLTASFPGVPLPQLASVLERLEQLEVDGVPLVDKDELYQMKEEIIPDLAATLKKIKLTEYLSKPDPDYNAIAQAFLKENQSGSNPQTSSLTNIGSVGSGLDLLKSNLSSIQQSLISTDRMLGGFFSSWTTSSPQVEVTSRDLPGLGGAAAGPKSDIANIFEAFKNAEEPKDILETFGKLKNICGVTDTDFRATYKKIKDKVSPAVTNSRIFWALIDKRLNQAEYKNGPKPPAKVVVVGAGPGGLRAAVESAFLGNEVTILEKRDLFSRNNLLHVWDATIRDLKNIGAKYFYPRFCLGGVNHISIRGLQGLLLKLNLLLGSHVILNVTFQTAKHQSPPLKSASGREVYWTAEIQQATNATNFTKEDLYINLLIGADGENSSVAKFANFQKKVLQGSRAIGITTNFVNTKTKAENSIKEVSLLAVYHQEFFKKLVDTYNIDLENLVYYREDTHYLVMTAKTESLHAKGVVKNKYPNIEQLLARENKDMSKLEVFVREVATYLGLPSTCQFVKTPSGANDVSIFDFSKKQQSVTPLQYIPAPNSNAAQNLPIVLTGDALVEPFWPLGTGANRAILAALDAAWVVKRSFGSDQKANSQQILKEASSAYRVLMTCTPDDLVSNFGLHSIEPSTRYRAVAKFR